MHASHTEWPINAAAVSSIEVYDPEAQHRIVLERLYGLDLINQLFVRRFRVAFFNFIRRGVDVAVGGLQYQSYAEFSAGSPSVASLNLVAMQPLHGTALIVFPMDFVYRVVDSLFGGNGTSLPSADRREFTITEQRVIRRVLKLAMDAYQDAWKVVHPVDLTYVRSEIQAKFANITNSPSETVISSTFKVEIAGGQNEFSICIPYAMVEPLREALTNSAPRQPKTRDTAWRQRVAAHLRESEVEVVVDIAEIHTTVGVMGSLKPGDVLPVDLPRIVIAKVEGTPIAECTYGRNGHRLALKVAKTLATPEGTEPTPEA